MSDEGRYPTPHPDLIDLDRVKPCRSLRCAETVGPFTDMTVKGISGFCRTCYDQLAADANSQTDRS